MSTGEILARESYAELISLLRWFSKSGPTPTLIGGWAVWVYNSYLGSADIDIVGPGLGGSFDFVIERYEQVHHYERVDRDPLGLEYAYRKPILRGRRLLGYVEIDASSFEADTGRFHEDRDKSLPYRLCADPRLVREIALDKDAVCLIPRKSLLFLYKLKAERRNWLEAKLSKDRSDLIALLDPRPKKCVVSDNIDYGLVRRIVEDRGLSLVYESISPLPERTEAIGRYSVYKKVGPREIEKWIEPLNLPLE